MFALVVSGLLVEVKAESRIPWAKREMRSTKRAIKILRRGNGGHITLFLSDRTFEKVRDKMRVMPDNWNSGG